jgi:hypothetical protein
MKQARRKELKTNELSIYLQQIQEAVVRHSNYIIGGIVVVVLILMIGLYVQSSRHQAETARWNELSEIRKEAAAGIKTETVDRAQRLADETAGDPKLAPVTREEHARLAYQLALTTSPVSNPNEYTRLLNEAKASYQKIIDDFADQPDIVAKGRLGLGSTLESLHVVGQGNLDAARDQYRKVAESGSAAFAEMAKNRLDTLAERTRPLNIVATLPAEPVETAPAETAPAESPEAAEAPAATAPAPATAPQS